MPNIAIALSERSVQAMFSRIRQDFRFSDTDEKQLLLYTLEWDLGVRLENGSLEFLSNDSVMLKELDLIYDPLRLVIGVDLPEITIGGQCIAPSPFGCLLRLPRWSLFSESPDFSIPLDIGGILRSEVSAKARIRLRRQTENIRPAGMSPHTAHETGLSDHWQVLLDVEPVHLKILDGADIAGELLDSAIDQAIEQLFAPLPGWARSAIRSMLGPMKEVIREILELPDDTQEWFEDNIWFILDLPTLIADALLDYYAEEAPLFEIEDPYPIIGGTAEDLPVLVSIENAAVSVHDNKELVVTARIGAEP